MSTCGWVQITHHYGSCHCSPPLTPYLKIQRMALTLTLTYAVTSESHTESPHHVPLPGPFGFLEFSNLERCSVVASYPLFPFMASLSSPQPASCRHTLSTWLSSGVIARKAWVFPQWSLGVTDWGANRKSTVHSNRLTASVQSRVQWPGGWLLRTSTPAFPFSLELLWWLPTRLSASLFPVLASPA